MTDDVLSTTFDLDLFDVDLVEGYELSSGDDSCFYIDGRGWAGEPTAHDVYGAAMEEMVADEGLAFDVVVGGETGGMVPGYELARRMGVPYGYVRKDAKKHGTGNRVDGVDVNGKTVLLVEDTSTTGGSIRDFLAGIRDAGGTVEHCLVLYDREHGAVNEVAKDSVTLHPVATVSELLAYGESHRHLSTAEVAAVRDEL